MSKITRQEIELRASFEKILPMGIPSILEKCVEISQEYASIVNTGGKLKIETSKLRSDISAEALIVDAKFCPKCNPNTWGNNTFQYLPAIQKCNVCGYEHRFFDESEEYASIVNERKDNVGVNDAVEIGLLAEENAIKNGYPKSDKTQFTATLWTLHNVFVEGFKKCYKMLSEATIK